MLLSYNQREPDPEKMKIFGNFFEKNVKFLAIFWHSNGNFPEGQTWTKVQGAAVRPPGDGQVGVRVGGLMVEYVVSTSKNYSALNPPPLDFSRP